MRRTGIWLGMLAMVTVGGSAFAAPSISLDGNWDDWFTDWNSTFNQNWDQALAAGNLTDDMIRVVDDPDTDPVGGQSFDIEQLFYFFDDPDGDNYTGGTLYIGMVTGFDIDGVSQFGDWYAGDFFLDFGADTDYDMAIAIGREVTPENGGDTSPVDGIGDRYGNAWLNAGWTTVGVPYTPNDNTETSPYRVDEGAGGVVDPTSVGVNWSIAFGETQSPYHNFLEICIEIDNDTIEELLNNGAGQGGLGLHWTMSCGNDAINVQDDVPLAPPPVPEPTTMVLLGMGVAGMVLRARRPSC